MSLQNFNKIQNKLRVLEKKQAELKVRKEEQKKKVIALKKELRTLGVDVDNIIQAKKDNLQTMEKLFKRIEKLGF